MKLISQVQISGAVRKDVGECRSVFVQSLDGTLYGIFDGEEVELVEGQSIELPEGRTFPFVSFRGASSTTATVHYGMVSFRIGGSSTVSTGGSMQIYTDSFDDPNGNLEPDETDAAAIYYKDQAEPVQQWNWSVTNQNWFPVITA